MSSLYFLWQFLMMASAFWSYKIRCLLLASARNRMLGSVHSWADDVSVEIYHVLWFSQSSAITALLIPTMLLRPLHFFVWPGKMQWKSSPCSSAALPCELGVVPWCWAVRWHFCMWEFFQHCCFSLNCFLGDAKASKPLVLTEARVLRLSWISGTWTIVWCFQHLRLEVEVPLILPCKYFPSLV